LSSSLYLEEWTCTTITANLFHWKKCSVVVIYSSVVIKQIGIYGTTLSAVNYTVLT